MTKWQKFCEQFEEQDTDLSRQLADAIQAVKTAENCLESTKREAKEDKDGEIKDDSEEMVDISDEENPEQLETSGVVLREGMNGMLKNLEVLKQQFETGVEMSSAKRPRLAEHAHGHHGDGGSSLQAAAGTPFAKPGQ